MILRRLRVIWNLTRWVHQMSLRWVLGHVIQHEAYHGGQIVMLHDLWKRSQT
jgi:uncharacterized damage-inducible protein DinB